MQSWLLTSLALAPTSCCTGSNLDLFRRSTGCTGGPRYLLSTEPPLQNPPCSMRNTSFLIQSPAFLIQKSSFVIQNASLLMHNPSFLPATAAPAAARSHDRSIRGSIRCRREAQRLPHARARSHDRSIRGSIRGSQTGLVLPLVRFPSVSTLSVLKWWMLY